MLRSAFLAAVLLAAVAASAVAQTQILDELKFGVLAHDVGLFDKHLESGADLNFEMLFTPPDFSPLSVRRDPILAVRSTPPATRMTVISA